MTHFLGYLKDLPEEAAPECYCGDWLRRGTYTLIHSRAGVGKTAVLAELMFSLRSGQDWFGMPCPQFSGRILYINGEMPGWQVNARLGYLKQFGFTTGIEIWHCPFHNLMDPTNMQVFIDLCASYELVIIDNRSCLFQIGDANEADSWKVLNQVLRDIPNNLGTALIMATHEGKGESTGAFGSSAQEWFADNVIRLSKPHLSAKEQKYFDEHCGEGKYPTRMLEFTKARLSAEISPIYFTFYQPTIGRISMEWRNWIK